MSSPEDALARADHLADAGHFAEAESIYRQMLAAEPNSARLRHHLATLLVQIGNWADAAAECRAAIRLRPDYAAAWNTLGVALSRDGQHDPAIAALRSALDVDPRYAKAAFNLGQAFDQCGRTQEAITAYRHALELDPSLEAASFELAALGQLPPPAAMPPAYVVQLFDTYATKFDRHLADLNYQVPRLLADEVRRLHPTVLARAVDLGCGTGLVGAGIRPLVEHLTGIDLAPAMIAAAAQRGVYDALYQAEAIEWLSADDSPAGDVDLLLGADLLIYLGDLTPLLSAARRRLKPGGLFAFSIECTTTGDHLLQPTRRYAHSVEYVRRLAARGGWAEVHCSQASLRRQGDHDVPGAIFVLAACTPQSAPV